VMHHVDSSRIPCRQRHGPIEAKRSTSRTSTPPTFRVGNDTAPLKPEDLDSRQAGGLPFRVGNDTAPLKLFLSRTGAARLRAFRVGNDTAPLKPGRDRLQVAVASPIPCR